MNINPQEILIEDYTYFLPHNRIAEFPLPERDSSKLLIFENGALKDDTFYHLPRFLPQNTTLVLNDSRVVEARLLFQKSTGGVIEIFCLEPHGASIEEAMQQKGSATWQCLIGGASKWKHGQVLEKQLVINGQPHLLQAFYADKWEDAFLIRFEWQPQSTPFVEILHAAGAIPLPPYIKRKAEDIDSERYQTVFSRHEGSVAAPTAALHFTQRVFEELKVKGIHTDYITLHVGAGTFKPVKSESIAGHHMHWEPFTVTQQVVRDLVRAERVVAVGTTSTRTLESLHWLGIKLAQDPAAEAELHQWEAYELAEAYGDIPYRQSLQALLQWMTARGLESLHCHTSIIIVPGYDFKIVQGLVTNFHQPQSTLLLLIAAFVGDDWKRIYRHALDNGYRFLSYGDSSLLWRK